MRCDMDTLSGAKSYKATWHIHSAPSGQLDELWQKLFLQVAVSELPLRASAKGEDLPTLGGQDRVRRAGRDEVDTSIPEGFDARWEEDTR